MDEMKRTLGRASRGLVLALLNATLILVALCLWLAWEVVTTGREVTAAVAAGIVELAPVRTELQSLTAGVAGLKATLDALPERALDRAAAEELRRQVTEMAALTATVNLRLQEALDAPEILIDRAIVGTAEAVAAQVSGLAGCGTGGAAVEG